LKEDVWALEEVDEAYNKAIENGDISVLAPEFEPGGRGRIHFAYNTKLCHFSPIFV
jgi:hypothetical protein